MKIQETEKSVINTNAPALKTIQTKVHNVAFTMSMLVNAYPNPIRTLTQEYLANGRDAVREAKNEKPLLITLPTEKMPTLKIRDFGIGLSEERVEEVFVSFGNTTKRHTNDLTGGFGIGGKSAWAYTDNFTIVSYYEGMARHYIALADGGNGIGELRLQAENPTTEPNGVEIQIPVKGADVEEFVKAVERATMFWEVKPEFVSESIIYSEPNFKADSVEFLPANNLFQQDSIYLAVDGIPYEVSSKTYGNLPEYISLKERLAKYDYYSDGRAYSYVVIRCNTGDVEIAMNREELQGGEYTTQGLKRILSNAQFDLDQVARRIMQEETTLLGLLEAHKKIRAYFQIVNHETFLDVSGEKYVVSEKGYIVSGLPSKLRCKRKFKKPRNKLEIADVNPSEVNLLNVFYSTKKLSNNSITIRLRNNMRETGDSSKWHKEYEGIVLYAEDLNDKECLDFFERIGAKNIFDLVVREAPIADRTTNENEVLINKFTSDSSWRNYQTRSDKVNLTENQTVYVYALKDSENSDQMLPKYFNLSRLIPNLGFEFCFIPPGREKKVINNEKFIRIDNFLKNLKKLVSVQHFDNVKIAALRAVSKDFLDQYNHLFDSADFMKEIPNLKDKESANLLSSLSNISKLNQLDNYADTASGLLESVISLCPEVNALKLDAEKILARFKKNYPTVSYLKYGMDSDMAKEVVWLINTKVAQGLKD